MSKPRLKTTLTKYVETLEDSIKSLEFRKQLATNNDFLTEAVLTEREINSRKAIIEDLNNLLK